MAAVKELIRAEVNGTLSFGDYTLEEKAKQKKIRHRRKQKREGCFMVNLKLLRFYL